MVTVAGTFDVYNQNSYDYDQTSGRFLHNGWEDTLVVFDPSDYNPNLAAINNQYFSLFDYEPYNQFVDGPYKILEVQNGNALLNVDSNSVYGLWSYVGSQGNTYATYNNNQFRVSAAGSADIGDHALQMGFEYEQRKDAFYSLSPIGLWTLARLTTNSHIKELNLNDSTVTNIGTEYYITYGRLIGDNQFLFDRNLRRELNLDPFGNDLINVDAIDPDRLTLDMFSADDLLNQGSNYVVYSGYDPYGNKVNGRPTIEDFFNEVDNEGFNTRPIGAYEPIYIRVTLWINSLLMISSLTWVYVLIDSMQTKKYLKTLVIGDSYTYGDVKDGLIPEYIGEDFEAPSNMVSTLYM